MKLTWIFWLGLIIYFIFGYFLFSNIDMPKLGFLVILYTIGVSLMGYGIKKEKKEGDYEEDEEKNE